MSIDWRCIVCGQPKSRPCINTINKDAPLPGRTEHLARLLPPNPKESK